MQRKGGGWSFGGLYSHRCMWPCSPLLRKLEQVIAKLEPLSKQVVLVRFLHNVDDAKALTGLIQELADAITTYQV